MAESQQIGMESNRAVFCLRERIFETLVTRQVLTDFVDAYDVLREMEDEKESGVSGSGCGPIYEHDQFE